MTTLTQAIADARHPLVVRWRLVTDERGRTRPEMRWTARPAGARTVPEGRGSDQHGRLAA